MIRWKALVRFCAAITPPRASSKKPSAGAEVVLCLNLTVASDLEPSWILISDRASQQGLVRLLAMEGPSGLSADADRYAR